MQFFRLIGVLSFVVAIAGVAGCGGGDGLASVEGTVTIDGEAMEGVEITFEPQFPGGSPSIGVTDADGYYVAMFTADKPGVQPGKHTVRIRATTYDDAGNATVLAEIPPKYSSESEITYEVEPGRNTFDLNVETQ